MRRIGNSIEAKNMIATRNGLRFSQASNQRVEVPPNVRYNFGTSDWMVSVIVSKITQGGILDIIGSDNSRVAFHWGTANQFNLISQSNSAVQLTFQPAVHNLSTSTFRLTLMRRGNFIIGLVNNKVVGNSAIGGGEQYNFYNAGQGLQIGRRWVSDPCDGLVSEILVGESMTDLQLEAYHNTNIIPASLHDSVIAHFPLNQNFGLKAWDVVEQYNYAKITTLSANHGDLINFTNDEAGVTNPLIQSAWHNFYAKQKRGLNFLKATNLLQVQKVGAPLAVTTWSLYVYVANTGTEVTQKIIFSTLNGVNEFVIYKVPNTNTAQVISQSVLYGLVFGNFFGLSDKGTGILFVSNGVSTDAYIKQGDDDFAFFETIANTLPQFEFNWMGNQTVAFQPYKSHIGKSSFFTKALNARERNLIMNSPRSDEYLSIDQAHFNLDFGDVFFNGIDYVVRDRSANNNHAKIFNFAPAADQPLRIEQHVSLPERRKAMRFIAASNHYLTVANFNPTKENGYTIIYQGVIGIFGYNAVFGKRDGGGNYFIIGYQNGGVSGQHFFNNPLDSFVWANGDTKNAGNLISVGIRISETPSNRFIEDITQVIKNNTSPNSIPGFNEVAEDMRIGSEPAGNYLDGYISHLSIFKKTLSVEQVLNIVNNSLGANINLRDLDCQLYLNFEEIINDAGTYKIKDWSPQNRTVILNNYSLAEITEGDPNYRLIDLDTLK